MVTVIIPVFNRKDLIKYTLDSLHPSNQPGVDIEVIVVDDGSTDGVVDFVKTTYPDVQLLRNPRKGASAARNVGLKAAKGDYVMYLDSDDLVGPGYFKEKIAFLEATPAADAVYGRFDWFEGDHEFSAANILFRHKYPFYDQLTAGSQHMVNYLSGFYLPQNSILFRRKFLLGINGHNEELPINQDVELVIRGLFHGMKLVACTDDTSVFVRSHGVDIRVGDANNATGKLEKILTLRMGIFKELGKFGFDEPKYRKALSTYLFNFWVTYRNSSPEMAEKFLAFAKKVFWPVEIKGSAPYRMLAKVVGPENAVKLKSKIKL